MPNTVVYWCRGTFQRSLTLRSPTAESGYPEAKSLGIDVSQATEAGLARAVAAARAERWLKETAEAIEGSNAYVEQHGLPFEKYRMF